MRNPNPNPNSNPNANTNPIRGYPDISTYGSNFFVLLDGEISRESGTSASSPVFGAMVTLWNDMRLGSC
jgi:tripeptidyl-peptidase-1